MLEPPVSFIGLDSISSVFYIFISGFTFYSSIGGFTSAGGGISSTAGG